MLPEHIFFWKYSWCFTYIKLMYINNKLNTINILHHKEGKIKKNRAHKGTQLLLVETEFELMNLNGDIWVGLLSHNTVLIDGLSKAKANNQQTKSKSTQKKKYGTSKWCGSVRKVDFIILKLQQKLLCEVSKQKKKIFILINVKSKFDKIQLLFWVMFT